MSAIVSLLLMLVSPDAFLIRQNIVFNKINDAGLARLCWLISMVIELSPYIQFLTKLNLDILKARHLVDSTAEKSNSPPTPEYKAAIANLDKRQTLFK